MELMDQYLNSVRPLLPEGQRDDILEELSEEIRSQMEAREAELGRPLTEAETNDILNRFGHPLLVGGRYQANKGSLVIGQELIGPELFPIYLHILKIALTLGIAGRCAVFGILSFWEPFQMGDFLGSFLTQIVIEVGAVTTLFAILQSHLRKNPHRWDTWIAPEAPKKDKRPSTLEVRVESIIQLVVTFTLFWWVRGMIGAGSSIIAPATLTPAWQGLYWILTAATALSCGHFALTFARPEVVRYQVPVRIAATALWLAGFVYVYQSGPWVTTTVAAKQTEVQRLNDGFFRSGILSMIAFLVIALIWEAVSGALRARREAR